MNLGVGVAQEFIGEERVNASTSDIFYKVYLKNKGNSDLVNVQLQSRLTDVFGAGNVSNVTAVFSNNPAGLTLNPAFDGITDVNLLLPGQILPNYPAENDSLSIIVKVRATNLVINRLYLSSVIGSGQVGTASNVLLVTDSSNNGNANKLDPDRNGVSDDAGEGIPTPYIFSVALASKEWQFDGSLQKNTARLQWRPAGQGSAARSFELQRSTDGVQFTGIAYRSAQPGNEELYTESDDVTNLHAANVYYRLKISGSDGSYTFSRIVTMNLKEANNNLIIFPNPFTDYISLKVKSMQEAKLRITIYDDAGRALKKQLNDLYRGDNIIIVSGLQFLSKGTYILKTESGTQTLQYKLSK
jgi:Secretion system C-terminal sorting domain